VHLLRIDQSGGAFDISYDAWNYLYTGNPAVPGKAVSGGPIEADYQVVPASECASLIRTPNGGLPLAAASSMNYLDSCMRQPGSWVGSNYQLYNINNPVCTYGVDERCTFTKADLDAGLNQPKCPSGLGLPVALSSQPVYNIKYPTGETYRAT